MTSADICRERGWGPGTILTSQDCTIRITAVGKRLILACEVGGTRESVWTLTLDEWREVREYTPQPCPHCGGDPYSEVSREGGMVTAWIECASCRMRGPAYKRTVSGGEQPDTHAEQACRYAMEAWDGLPRREET